VSGPGSPKLPARKDALQIAMNTNGLKDWRESMPAQLRVNHTPGIVTITDANTTIAYCRYDESGEIEYVFVSASHRRMGYGKWLLAFAEEHLVTIKGFQPPISPLGEKLVGSYKRRRRTE